MKNNKCGKLNSFLKGLRLFSFGLITCVATATLTYFIAPGENSNGSPNRAPNKDSFTQTHGDILFSNISGVSKLSLKGLVGDITLPDNDFDENTSNHISLIGNVALSMPTLSELALNLDTTLTYDGYSSVKAVKKDLDVTYLGSTKDLYLSLTDGYFDENNQKKTISYLDNPYTSGIRYCVSGTEYDDIVDTIYTMLKESVRFSDSFNGDNEDSSSGSTSSLTDLMSKLSISLIEDENKEYQYTFTLDLGKEGWDPICLKMSSDEECNLTGIWTEEDSPIKIPLGDEKYCVISLSAKDVSMVEETLITTPKDADSYSKLINSTSLMKKVFNIVDKEAFGLDISGKLIHKYGEKKIVSEDGSINSENLHETLSLDAKLSVDYLNNLLDFNPTLISEFDEGDKPVSYGLNMALRPLEEDRNKSNLYFTYNANDAALAKLNFTNMKSINKFLGSLVDSFGNISSNIDVEKISNVINYFTSLIDDGKEVITGKAALKGNGEPSDSLGNIGDTYLNEDNNRKYTKGTDGWRKNELTLIDEIKEGHYQRCFDILKGVYTGDDLIYLVLTLEPFGLGENATITFILNGSDSSSDLASITLGNLEFSDFQIKDFSININEIKADFSPIDAESFQKVNNMPAMFDEFATLTNSKKAGLTFKGEFQNDIAGESKSLSSLSFAGAAKFDAKNGNQGAKISLDIEQVYQNATNKNVKHDLRFEIGKVINQEEIVSANGEVITPEEHDYCTKFAYQSKDENEQKGEERGGLYGKGYLSSLTDLFKYLRTLLSDEKTTLRERLINPVRDLITIANLSNINKNGTSETSDSDKRYFSFLETNYLKGIENQTDGDLETLTLTLSGAAFNLNSDITFTMVRYAKDNANHKAGELESFNLVDLSLGANKKLNLSFGVEKYEDITVKECPLDKASSEETTAKNYYDFSSLSTLAKFGINTGLKQDSYYWSGNISVNLGSLKGIIDVNTNLYIKVSGSSFKMMGDFSLPLIPEVNGPTDSAPEALRVAAGLGTRSVKFYYDSNTDYETKKSDSRIYFVGSSDVKGNVFDTKDYASFDINYVLNHASDVFLGYVLDVYPTLLAKDEKQESTVSNEKASSTEVTLDNEYDSLIKNYYAPEVGENGSWGISFDFASLLGVMSVHSSSFDFDMSVRHLADLDLLVKTENDILVSFLADIKIYLGIRISIGLVNNNPLMKEENSKVFHSEIADEKFVIGGEFDSYISNHQSDTLNTVYSQKKTKLEGQETYCWGDYSVDESWILSA